MSSPPSRPGGIPIDVANEKIAKKFNLAIPRKDLLPSAIIRLQFIENSHIGDVEFRISCGLSARDFRAYMEEEEQEQQERVTFVADAFIHGGFFILYSTIRAVMVCMKFGTDIEAKAYAAHYKLSGFLPSKQHIAVDEDPWFDGEFPQRQAPSLQNGRMRGVLLEKFVPAEKMV